MSTLLSTNARRLDNHLSLAASPRPKQDFPKHSTSYPLSLNQFVIPCHSSPSNPRFRVNSLHSIATQCCPPLIKMCRTLLSWLCNSNQPSQKRLNLPPKRKITNWARGPQESEKVLFYPLPTQICSPKRPLPPSNHEQSPAITSKLS